MAPSIISVRNLKKTFKTHKREGGFLAALKSLIKREFVKKVALNGISFTIKEGEIVGLIGPNGAGKSTCIKALCGIIYPDEGEVRVMNYAPWKDRIKYVQNIGVIFGQKTQLWWDLPAIDTFELHRSIYNIPKTPFERRMHYMSKLLEVEDVAKTPVRQMSLGERMKCEAIASLLHNPKVVFFDEPTIGMDVIAKDRLRKFVKEVNKEEGTTFIITTHNMDDIEELCERVIVINHGEIIYDGSFAEIKKRYVHSKVLDIKFDSKVGALELPPNCKVLKKSGLEVTIEVNTDKQKISEVVNHLLQKFSIADITISDPPIDEIIAAIYSEEGKHEQMD